MDENCVYWFIKFFNHKEKFVIYIVFKVLILQTENQLKLKFHKIVMKLFRYYSLYLTVKITVFLYTVVEIDKLKS